LVVFFGSYALGDCPDLTYSCDKDRGNGKSAGEIKVGQCWKGLGCYECRGGTEDHAKIARECNEKYASQCEGNCYACAQGVVRKSSPQVLCFDTDGHVHAFDISSGASKPKTQTQWTWFNLPDDGWGWPIYILALWNGSQTPASFTLTLKDWQQSPLSTLAYTVNPEDTSYVNLNTLWPSHFDYSVGGSDIPAYIIEVQATGQLIAQYFTASSDIYACFNAQTDIDAIHSGHDTIALPVTAEVAGDALYDGTTALCYGRYFGISFNKLPKSK